MDGFLLELNGCTTCQSHDASLGEVVLSLPNLQSLAMTCILCDKSHGQEYLFKLNSPALREFTFYCYGSAAFGSDTDDRSVLLATFMSQLTVLSLDCEKTRGNSRWESLNEQLLRTMNTLSRLETLVHHFSPFFDSVLSHRRIRWLYFISSGIAAPVAAIRKSPGRLTHLFSPSLIDWLPQDRKFGVEPYIHLRFIGTITGIYPNAGSSQFPFRKNTKLGLFHRNVSPL